MHDPGLSLKLFFGEWLGQKIRFFLVKESLLERESRESKERYVFSFIFVSKCNLYLKKTGKLCLPRPNFVDEIDFDRILTTNSGPLLCASNFLQVGQTGLIESATLQAKLLVSSFHNLHELHVIKLAVRSFRTESKEDKSCLPQNTAAKHNASESLIQRTIR